MNDDLSAGRWQEVSAQARVWWDKLTDDDLTAIAGRAERLAGLLQQKYGYTRQNAESQSNRWMRKHQPGPAAD